MCGGGKWGLDELGVCGARLPLKILQSIPLGSIWACRFGGWV